jgi:hypothetical protein
MRQPCVCPSGFVTIDGRCKADRKSIRYKDFINSLKIINVDTKIDGFFHGMNPLAAQSLKVKYPYDDNTVVVDNSDKEWLINHERDEYYYMRFLGIDYDLAHAYTLLDTHDCKTLSDGLEDARKMKRRIE